MTSFAALLDVLIDEARARIRNGEITERSLARMAGVSQPHVHNLLKGRRELSRASADRLLKAMRLSVTDLLACIPKKPCSRACTVLGVLPAEESADARSGPEPYPWPREAAVSRYISSTSEAVLLQLKRRA